MAVDPAGCWRHLVVVAAGLLLSACSGLRYYAHVAHGEGQLLFARRPIETVVRDPATPIELARRLRLAQEARQFASTRLGLPDNRSYTTYVDLHRPFVAWNVFVTPPYAVDARPQCFPIAGCVAYRGWFDEARARSDAARWKARGDDVWIGPVPAYSTLGWFADPVLSSMLRWDDDELAGTIFHELAHQLIYLKGETAFNESFASLVQRQGLRAWHRSRGLPAPDLAAQAMDAGFTRLVLDLRERLASRYAQGGDVERQATAKAREIADFRVRYRRWRDSCWPGRHGYDAWVAAPINNAKLLPFGLYDSWTPAFATLFRQSGHAWAPFYARVRALAALPAKQRQRTLQQLLAAGRVPAHGSVVAGTLVDDPPLACAMHGAGSGS
jgi:predicted aminopeptidase